MSSPTETAFRLEWTNAYFNRLLSLMPMNRLLLAFLLFLITACSQSPQALPTLAPLPEEILRLPYWETVSSNLSEIGTSQFWQFAGEANAPIFIAAVSREAELSLRLYLEDTLLQEAPRIEITLPENNLYRLEVVLISGGGNYDLGLGYTDRLNPTEAIVIPATVGVPTPTPSYANLGEFIGNLSFPTDYAGLLNANSSTHVYTLQGQAGAIVSFELFRIGGTLDPVLRLYDADGTMIAEDDNSLGGVNARLLNINLPQTGLYSVQVGGKGFFGDYTLVYVEGTQTIQPDSLPTIEPTTVAPYITPIVRIADPSANLIDHFPVISLIQREGGFERFAFAADAGEVVSLLVRPHENSTLLPQVEIFNPNGEQVAIVQSSRTNGIAAIPNLQITESGSHIVIVTGENNSIGQFLIGYGRGSTSVDEFRGTAISNLSQEARIDTPTTRHIWEIRLNPRDVITVAVSPNDELFDPVVELVTAEGIVVYRDDNSGNNRIAMLQLAEIYEPATYLLRIYDATGQNTGGYSLLWRYVNIAPTATPRPRTTTLFSVNDRVEAQAYQFYSFQGEAGQEIQVDVFAAANSSIDPVLALLAPNGDILAENDDSNGSLNPSLRLQLPVTGTYRIRVNGYLSAGDFTAIVSLLWD